MQNRSISQRLQRCNSKEKRKEIIVEWVSKWKSDLQSIIDRLSKAHQKKSWYDMQYNISQLVAGCKRFNGLQSIFSESEANTTLLQEWKNDSLNIIYGICKAENIRDWDAMSQYISQLKDNHKKFNELQSFLNNI